MWKLFSLVALVAGCGSVFDLDKVEPAAPPADAGDTTFCTGMCSDPASCACIDFDETATLPPEWEIKDEGNGKTTITSSDARSAPRSAYLHTPASPSVEAGERHIAALSRGLIGANQHVVLDFDWKLAYFDPTATPHTIQLFSAFLANISNCGFGHAYDGSTDNFYLSVPTNGTFVIHIVPPPPTNAGKWTHVRLDVRFDSAGQGHAYLAFDGTEVVHVDNITTAPPTDSPTSITANALSITWQGTNPDLQQFYDNLIFTVD